MLSGERWRCTPRFRMCTHYRNDAAAGSQVIRFSVNDHEKIEYIYSYKKGTINKHKANKKKQIKSEKQT